MTLALRRVRALRGIHVRPSGDLAAGASGPSVAVGVTVLAGVAVGAYLLGRSAGYEQEHDLLHRVTSGR